MSKTGTQAGGVPESYSGILKVKKSNKIIGAVVLAALTVSSALADAPTSLDGFDTVATGYISKGTTVAIAAAVLGMGWVGYRIVKKFTKGAAST